ncbi:solute carrier family 23 member 1-like [Apostichopus japonicus]|uniref:solute carrier family 23 member 1-like n=1 Tax=Stichopus japonicus TaxID=307972 RepID=UPI003AB5C173
MYDSVAGRFISSRSSVIRYYLQSHENMDSTEAIEEEERGTLSLKDKPSESDQFHQTASNGHDEVAIIYGIEDRPPWPTVILGGLQHFSASFSGCLIMPLVIAIPLCFDRDRDLTNQLIGTSFFMCGVTTFLQTFIGTRLPIIQGSSSAFVIPAYVLFSLSGPCPPPVTANSTAEASQVLRDVAFDRMQELQGSLCLATVVQFLLGFTGVVGLLLQFVRPLTIATTLFLIGIPLIPITSDACGTHWGIASLTIFLITLFSQFLDKYPIPLPNGKKIKIFTFFPILLAIAVSWTFCIILTAAGAFPDDPTAYGYKARTDVYSDVIRDTPWLRVPYPGQFGRPRVNVAGFLGMISGVFASIVESVGDYHGCALISGVPPPTVAAINRGIAMEGIGCALGGLWGAATGYTSYSNNVSIISISKIASRSAAYFAAGFYIVCGMLTKVNALWASMPEAIYGAVLACTIGMIASIGFANLSFVKVDTSRNLFILGFGLFIGLGVPDYLAKNPGAIQTGSGVIDQIFTVVLGSNMFIGGITVCILDNLVRGTDEEKGVNWRQQMANQCKEDGEGEHSCYDLPFGMDWIRRTLWTQYFPFSPTFKGFTPLIRRRYRSASSGF